MCLCVRLCPCSYGCCDCINVVAAQNSSRSLSRTHHFKIEWLTLNEVLSDPGIILQSEPGERAKAIRLLEYEKRNDYLLWWSSAVACIIDVFLTFYCVLFSSLLLFRLLLSSARLSFWFKRILSYVVVVVACRAECVCKRLRFVQHGWSTWMEMEMERTILKM